MSNKLNEAFDMIKADDALKNNTKAYIFNEMNKRQKPHFNFRYTATLASCVFVFVTAMYWVFLVPTAEISIDINPSIELQINRLDKVIKAKAYNQDGEELLDGINTNFIDYEDVVNEILSNQTIVDILNEDGVMTISVISDNDDQEGRVLEDMQHHSRTNHQVECYTMKSEESHAAHNLGMSCGKYRHYQILAEYDSSITPEQVQSMTMREIKDLINELAANNPDVNIETDNGHHSQDDYHHGGNNHNNKGQGNCPKRNNHN